MVCEEIIAGSEPSGSAAPEARGGVTKRTRIKGRKNRQKETKKPLMIEETDNVEYIGIEENATETEKPLEKLLDDTESANDDQSSEKKEDPVIPERPHPTGEPEPVKPEIVAEGFSSDAETDDRARLHELGQGLIYEVAEELYVRERTAAELEALAKPPFQRVFDEYSAESLDREARARTRRLIETARENSPPPTFLPEAVYEENSKPLRTTHALAAELIMLVPVVNVGAALILSLSKSANRNLRSLARAFLIITGITLAAAGAFIAGRLLQ